MIWCALLEHCPDYRMQISQLSEMSVLFIAHYSMWYRAAVLNMVCHCIGSPFWSSAAVAKLSRG